MPRNVTNNIDKKLRNHPDRAKQILTLSANGTEYVQWWRERWGFIRRNRENTDCSHEDDEIDAYNVNETLDTSQKFQDDIMNSNFKDTGNLHFYQKDFLKEQ